MNEVSEALQQSGDGLDEETADCSAQIVVEDVGVEELQDLDLTADEPPEALQDEFAAALFCRRVRSVTPRVPEADEVRPSSPRTRSQR